MLKSELEIETKLAKLRKKTEKRIKFLGKFSDDLIFCSSLLGGIVVGAVGISFILEDFTIIKALGGASLGVLLGIFTTIMITTYRGRLLKANTELNEYSLMGKDFLILGKKEIEKLHKSYSDNKFKISEIKNPNLQLEILKNSKEVQDFKKLVIKFISLEKPKMKELNTSISFNELSDYLFGVNFKGDIDTYFERNHTHIIMELLKLEPTLCNLYDFLSILNADEEDSIEIQDDKLEAVFDVTRSLFEKLMKLREQSEELIKIEILTEEQTKAMEKEQKLNSVIDNLVTTKQYI